MIKNSFFQRILSNHESRPGFFLFLWCISIIIGFIAQYLLVLQQVSLGYMAYAIGSIVAVIIFWVANSRISALHQAKKAIDANQKIRLQARKRGWLLFFCCLCLIALGTSVYFLETEKFMEGFWLWISSLVFLGAGFYQSDTGTNAAKIKGFLSYKALIICLILVAAFLLRAYGLLQIPPLIHPDEALSGLDARNLLEGKTNNVFSVGFGSQPAISFGIYSVFMEIFGNNLYGLRMTSVILGTLCVLLLFLFVEELISFRVAILSAIFLSISQWHIHYSRIGIIYIESAFAGLLFFYLLIKSLRTQNRFAFVLTGFAAAFCMYVYLTARMFLIIAFLFILHKSLFERGFVKRNYAGLLICFFAALIFVMPLGLFYAHHPEILINRSEDFIFNDRILEHSFKTYNVDSFLEVLYIHFVHSVQAFNLRGENSRHYGPSSGLLDFWVSPFFVLGLMAVTIFLTKSEFFLLAEWFWLTLIVGSVLTSNAMFSPHVVGIIPIVFVFPALFIEVGWQMAASFFKKSGKAFFLFFIILLVILAARSNYDDYFKKYVAEHPADGPTVISRYVGLINDEYVVYAIGESLSLKYETQRFMLPDLDGVNVGSKNLTLPIKIIPGKKGAAFLVQYNLPDVETRLELLREAYPSGRTTLEKNTNGRPVFYSYLVGHEQLVEANPDAIVTYERFAGISLDELNKTVT